MDIIEKLNNENKVKISEEIRKRFESFLCELEKLDSRLVNKDYIRCELVICLNKASVGMLVSLINQYSPRDKYLNIYTHENLEAAYKNLIDEISQQDILYALENVLDQSKGENKNDRQ